MRVLYLLGIILLLGTGNVKAQAQYEVRGLVTNATTGKGFAGASITSPSAKTSAMTGDDGTFVITLPSLNLPIEVSAPGFEPRIVPVQGNDYLEIVLFEEKITGESLQGGTITIIDGLATSSDVSLQSISRSGEPGHSATYFIRGMNSINRSSQPLFVVDGVIWQMQEGLESSVDGYVNNPLTLISPDDIEDIQVLRNGSSIWGVKGANGVVLIRTKRAQNIATRIEANISMGVQTPFSVIPVMESDAYRRYATDVMSQLDKKDISKFQFISDDPSKSFYRANHNNTNWMDQITKTSFIQNYGISVSGGDDKALYRFSLGFAQNDGNIEGTRFNRLNVRFNSNINLTNYFTIQTDIAYAQTMHKVVFEGLDAVRSPYLLAHQKSPLYSPYTYNLDGTLNDRLSDTDELNVGNPLALLNDNVPGLEKYRFNANLRPSFKFTDKLSLTALLGYSWDKTNEDLFLPDTGLAEENLINAQGEIYAIGRNQVRNFMARQSSISLDSHLRYQLFDDWRHYLSLMLGGRFYQTYNRYNYGFGYNTGSDYIRVLGSTSSDLRFPTAFEYKDRNAAWYFQADYNYQHRYFLRFEASLESSSRFGSEANLNIGGSAWAFSPSVEGRWVISNEKWMKGSNLDNLQLRVAYTRAANDDLPLFATRNYFKSAPVARDAQGLLLANIGNPKLKWETTGRFDIGADLSVLHNRLNVSADYYRNRTTDLVVQKSLAEISGLTHYWDNDGELTNCGFETSVRARLVEHRDWRLDLGFTIAHNCNKITKLNHGSFTTDFANGQILTAEGNPVGVFYGYRTNGVYSSASEAKADGLAILSESGQRMPFSAGDMRFVDQNRDGLINDADRIVLGNPNPDFFGKLHFNLSWKRLTLHGLFTYSYGNEAYNALRATLESGSDLMNQSTAMESRWMADGQITNIPRAVYADPMGNSRFSDRWIEDASYLKFKRLQLTYDVPLRHKIMQGVCIWAAVNNLFTLTPYLGADPEFSVNTSNLLQGVDVGLTPQSRNYMIGVKFNL